MRKTLQSESATEGGFHVGKISVDALLHGTQSLKLSLKSMLRGILLSWVEQRRKLGLASA